MLTKIMVMKRTKTVKAMLAVGAAVTMLLGTSLTALAAPACLWGGTAEDYQTNPRAIQEADANVIATSDATQPYLTGSMTLLYDRYGSPDPQLINYGDGTWVLIMYEYQEVALGLNNPYTAYSLYKPQVAYANPTYHVADDGGIDPDWDDIVVSYNYGDQGFSRSNWSDTYNYVYIDADRGNTGSAVYNIQFEFDPTLGCVDEDTGEIYYASADWWGFPETIGDTITLAVYVLPAQPGTQDQICAAHETHEEANGSSLAKIYSKHPEYDLRYTKAIN